MVGGPAVAQSCMAGDLAQPGEVVLSGEALAKAHEVVTGDQMPAGGAGAVALRVTAVKPPAETPPADGAPAWRAPVAALGAYVPRAIVGQLVAGQSAWLSELRHVSVLFLRLPELDDITQSSVRRAGELVRPCRRRCTTIRAR